MLSVCLAWIICGFTFLVFGKLLISICNSFLKEKGSYGLVATYFIGICFIGTLLSFLSLFVPINSTLGLSLFFIAILYAGYLQIIKKDTTWGVWLNKFLQLSPFTKWTILIILVIVLIYNLTPPFLTDMQLYYMQTILWNESYPVIPGLANIHGRFGFNSNILLLSSAFSLNDIFPVRIYGILSLSIFMLISWVLVKIENLTSFIPKIALLFLCFMFIWGYNFFMSSPSTDILPNVIVLFIILNAVFDKSSYINKPLLYSILPIYAITLKLSVVPICLFFVYILIVMLKNKAYNSIIVLLSLSVLTILPWLIRNIIITGYLIYPFPSIDIFSFDWKIPQHLAEEEKGYVSSWARMPGLTLEEYTNMPFGEWIKFWLLRHIHYLKLFLLTYCLAGISPLIMLLLKKKKTINTFQDIFPWFIAFCGFVFWFVLAPDGRFGLSFILAAALIPALFIKINVKIKKQAILYKLIACVFLLLIVHNVTDSFIKVPINKNIISYLYIPASFTDLEDRKVPEFTTIKAGNIDIYIPDNSLCSDHPIPCAPYPVNNLEMRGDKIEDGFRIKTK